LRITPRKLSAHTRNPKKKKSSIHIHFPKDVTTTALPHPFFCTMHTLLHGAESNENAKMTNDQ
jgi:hypothetical protein